MVSVTAKGSASAGMMATMMQMLNMPRATNSKEACQDPAQWRNVKEGDRLPHDIHQHSAVQSPSGIDGYARPDERTGQDETDRTQRNERID